MERLQKQSDVKFILGITVKLLIISTVTALLLSCVNALTKDKIAENIAKEKNAAIESIFTQFTLCEPMEPAPDGISALYEIYSDSEKIGYAAELNTMGFGGEMTVMVGVDSSGKVVGVKLISHSETPGLGNRVGEAAHLSQYTGRDSESIKSGIDVITGSTISSNAIRDTVEKAISLHSSVFGEGGAK